MTRNRFTWALACTLGLLMAGPTRAAEWPEKDFTWIVGYPPGGSVDLLTRIAARKLSERSGRNVVVENRPGANGVIAMQYVAKAPADGYTLMSIGGPVVSKQAVPEFGRDLLPIGVIATAPMVVVAPANSRIASAAELFADIRKHPGTWSFGSSGAGSPQHLAGELINAMLQADMVHVAYKGGAPAVNDVVGGQIPLAVLGPSTVMPFIKAGRLKPLAVTTRTRSDVLPEVPTLAESGLAGFDASQWVAVAVPAGVPRERLARMHQWLQEAIASPEIAQALVPNGMGAGKPASVEALRDALKADTDQWKALVVQRRLMLD